MGVCLDNVVCGGWCGLCGLCGCWHCMVSFGVLCMLMSLVCWLVGACDLCGVGCDGVG